ncbi:hypothetical protein SLS58_000351 [Diplodia intermedia]|uniref:Uncharacterized protein n=1 Tax=Diplodia intermedia TaxID=856260 RepID=A0ABR3U5G2_9PEZI
MEDPSSHTATDMNELAVPMRRRRGNTGKAPSTNNQARSGGLQLFGRRTEESSKGTPRETLAKLDSLSTYSTQKRLAADAKASDRPTPLSSTSASIKINDLATNSSAVRKILSSLSKKPPPYQDPVPFMRLPAEIRVMVYERTWTVIDCPWKMTRRAGRRERGDTLATNIEYWLGPAPKSQVQYPKAIMTMDSRIKEEFVHELCARFPVQMYISGLFTERTPNLSMHKPSIFFNHIRQCQMQYFPRFLSDPSHVNNASGNRAILRTDLASLVELSLLFPCLEKMVIHMPLDFRVLLSDDVTSLNVTSVLQTIILEEVFRRDGKDRHLCFSLWEDDSFIMGWHTDGTRRSIGTTNYSSMCTALNMKSHDVEHCTHVWCQCTAVMMGSYRSFATTRDAGRRMISTMLRWIGTNFDTLSSLLAAITVVFQLWPYSESLTTLLNLNNWREAFLPTFIRLLFESLRVELILDYSRTMWRKRDAFYALSRTVGHRMWQNLAILTGNVPLFAASPSISCLAPFGHCLDRTVSFMIELAVGVLFETFLHVICWVHYGLYLFIPQTMSFLLMDWQPPRQLKNLPGFGFVGSLLEYPHPNFLDDCLTGTHVVFGFTGTKIAQACGNVRSDLRDLEWTIRTTISRITI